MLAALKNANDMLKDVVKAMDRNGDEVIQFDGTFRSAHRSFGCWCFVTGPDAGLAGPG